MSDSGSERFIEETRDASPANLLTKFESFSSFAKCGIAQYESKAFEAGGYKWKMILYPESEMEDCHVCVDFAIAETESLPVGWKVNAIFAFFVYNHRLDNYLCFRGFIVDDSCVFGAEVFVIKNPPITECLSLVKDTAPFKSEWKILGISQLGHGWNSEVFVVGNHKWKVTVNASTSFTRTSPYMSIFLECVDADKFGPHKKVKAEICMRIRNKLNANHVSLGYNLWFTSESRRWGFPEFLSIDALRRNGCLIDDFFFLDVERWSGLHLTNFSWGFNEFKAIDDMKDPSKGFVVDDCCNLQIQLSVRAIHEAPHLA